MAAYCVAAATSTSHGSQVSCRSKRGGFLGIEGPLRTGGSKMAFSTEGPAPVPWPCLCSEFRTDRPFSLTATCTWTPCNTTITRRGNQIFSEMRGFGMTPNDSPLSSTTCREISARRFLPSFQCRTCRPSPWERW